MFLQSLTLTNFKCHDKLWINFACDERGKPPVRKTTFVLGENGVGKTAVLKAIALITAGSNTLGQLIGNPDEWIKNRRNFCQIEATLVTSKGEKRNIKLRIERGQNLSQIISANVEDLAQIDAAISHTERSYFVVGYGASRRMNKGQSESFGSGKHFYSGPRFAQIQSLFVNDIPLTSLSSWAMELDYKVAGSGLATVRKALNSFLLSDVKFKRIDKKKGQLIFSTPDGEVPLEQLSEGYQNVSAWVGDLLFQITNSFEDYKTPLNTRGLLLIDEIDLHLHPRWQRQLHQFLKERLPNFQVIATTHSPLTAQGAGEDELYALRREGKAVELVPFSGDPSKMLVSQLLMSPIFGLETDESIKVEAAKAEVNAIKLKARPSAKERAAVRKQAAFLETVPIAQRSNSLLSNSDFELLVRINEELDATPAKKQTPLPKKVKASKSVS